LEVRDFGEYRFVRQLQLVDGRLVTPATTAR